MASAQVKSCLLFAGLFAERGVTTIEEAIPTRDHTERMLRRRRRAGRPPAGARLDLAGHPPRRCPRSRCPGDFSSAAPFIAAATMLAGSNLTIQDVGINPTRTGMLAVLERMGARVGLFGPPLGGRRAGRRHRGAAAELVATEVEPELVPSLIDELPLIVLVASFARGTTIDPRRGRAAVKESDRIATVVERCAPSAATSRRWTTASR